MHLVFPPGFEPLEEELTKAGVRLTGKDYNFEQFHAAFLSGGVRGTVAFVYGPQPELSDQGYLRLVEEIRLKRPEFRLIFVFDRLETYRNLVQGLVDLGVYDIYITTEFTVEDVLGWVSRPRTIAYARRLLSGLPFEEPEEPSAILPVYEPKPAEATSGEKKQVKPKAREKSGREKPGKGRKPRFRLLNWLFSRRKKEKQKPEAEEEVPAIDLDRVFSAPGPEARPERYPARAEFGPASTPERLVLGIFSGRKGSVGKTTLALSLSALYGREGNVGVIDADELTRAFSLIALGDTPGEAMHSGKLGVTVHPPTDAGKIETLRQRYDVLIVDFGNFVTPTTKLVLSRLDRILLVIVPEPLMVSIISASFPAEFRDKALLVVNRYTPGSGEDPWVLARSIGMEPALLIPEDPAVNAAFARGALPLEARAFRENVVKLTEMIAGRTPRPV